MAFCTAKLTELPLHNSISLRSHSSSLTLFFTSSSSSSSKPSFSVHKPFSSLRTIENSVRSNASRNLPSSSNNTHYKSRSSSSAPWINKWPSTNIPSSERRVIDSDKRDKPEERVRDKNSNGERGRGGGGGAIERIVLRLRNLGLGSDDEEEEDEDEDDDDDVVMEKVTGEEKLGDLLQRKWSRPDSILDEDEDEDEKMLLPWERGDDGNEEVDESGFKKKKVKAPSVAELTIEDAELRRLRTLGMGLRERINIPKAGVTQVILEKIHDKWRKSELVRLKFHETLAHDMRTAHEIVERRSGGLVIWRAGSVMVVYRGSNYDGPSSSPRSVDKVTDNLFVPDITSADLAIKSDDHNTTSVPQKRELYTVDPSNVKKMTVEEAEYKGLLDDLGPRFVDWWGTGLLPVDADLLPPAIPGYKTPFRLLPNGMRPRLTNAEMTNLRKLAKSLPCHFAIGRNRNHQGLASAIVKLWDKSLVAKIAIKRGIQNTNNKLMAEELKMLTGGILLLRNKFYIVIYRGKDFVPTGVASVLTERQELTKRIQDVEEKMRIRELTAARATPIESFEGKALAGTLAEFYEAQARWGREISAEELGKMKEEDSKVKNARVVRKVEHKLSRAQDKMMRAEKLLAKIEVSMVPAGPCDDQETITDEERFMLRRVGLKMRAYLPIGIRGVFDGVIENMHLHWKHRELVKLISKQKTLSFVEDTARLLEHESGGILVAIERVPKGYALIYYRGKNYQRPISLRPRNLLTKAKALKRSVAMQRHEALSQHIFDLEKTIAKMSPEIGNDSAGNSWSTDNQSRFEHGSVLTRSEYEGSNVEFDNDDDDDDDDDFDEESDDDYDADDYDDDNDDDNNDDDNDDDNNDEDNENLARG